MNFTAENVDLRIFLDICSRDWGEQIEKNWKKLLLLKSNEFAITCLEASGLCIPLHTALICCTIQLPRMVHVFF